MKQNNNLYVVLGMPRSGTSVITKSLETLGISLGNKLAIADKKWNPTGFWEDHEIVYQVNEKILATLNYKFDDIELIPSHLFNDPRLMPIKHRATLILKDRFKETSHWCFKDPRTVRVLPFWQALFDELKLNEHYIICLRHPFASAKSLKHLSKKDIEIGLMLWLIHVFAAIEGTFEKKRIVVSYDLMLNNPEQQLKRLKKNLNIRQALAEEKVQTFMQFLDTNIQHFSDEDQTENMHPVVPLCTDIYELLLKVAMDDIHIDDQLFKMEWQQIILRFEKVYPIYTYLNTQLKNNHELQKRLHTIHRSIPWKMIYPLRIVDDFLRNKRKMSRANKREASKSG